MNPGDAYREKPDLCHFACREMHDDDSASSSTTLSRDASQRPLVHDCR